MYHLTWLLLLSTLASILAFTACGPSPEELTIQTASAQTAIAAAWTTTPTASATATSTPTSTSTLTPTPTNLATPAVAPATISPEFGFKGIGPFDKAALDTSLRMALAFRAGLLSGKEYPNSPDEVDKLLEQLNGEKVDGIDWTKTPLVRIIDLVTEKEKYPGLTDTEYAKTRVPAMEKMFSVDESGQVTYIIAINNDNYYQTWCPSGKNTKGGCMSFVIRRGVQSLSINIATGPSFTRPTDPETLRFVEAMGGNRPALDIMGLMNPDGTMNRMVEVFE